MGWGCGDALTYTADGHINKIYVPATALPTPHISIFFSLLTKCKKENSTNYYTEHLYCFL